MVNDHRTTAGSAIAIARDALVGRDFDREARHLPGVREEQLTARFVFRIDRHWVGDLDKLCRPSPFGGLEHRVGFPWFDVNQADTRDLQFRFFLSPA